MVTNNEVSFDADFESFKIDDNELLDLDYEDNQNYVIDDELSTLQFNQNDLESLEAAFKEPDGLETKYFKDNNFETNEEKQSNVFPEIKEKHSNGIFPEIEEKHSNGIFPEIKEKQSIVFPEMDDKNIAQLSPVFADSNANSEVIFDRKDAEIYKLNALDRKDDGFNLDFTQTDCKNPTAFMQSDGNLKSDDFNFKKQLDEKHFNSNSYNPFTNPDILKENKALQESITSQEKILIQLKQDKENIMLQLQAESEMKIKMMQKKEQEKYTNMECLYKEQLKRLSSDLENLQKENASLKQQYSELEVKKRDTEADLTRLAQENELRILGMKKDILKEKENKLIEFANDFATQRQHMIDEHEEEINQIRREHKREIESLKNEYTIEIEQLRKDNLMNVEFLENRIMQQQVKKVTVGVSCKSAVSHFGLQTERFLKSSSTNTILVPKRDAWVMYENQNEFQRKEMVDSSVQTLVIRPSRSSRSIQVDMPYSSTELRKVAQKIKDQCTKIYEGNIQSLKEEINRLCKDNAGNTANMYEAQIFQLSKRIESLQTSWKKEKETYQQLLETTKKTFEDDKQLSIQKIKVQYLDTLKRIKVDVEKNKAELVNRVRKEFEEKFQERISEMNSQNELK
jgi:hypothetical protein